MCASARAFVSPRSEGGGQCGGNPVSIFLSSGPTTSAERTGLAQTCHWESIVIEQKSESSDGPPPTFHFYMPSGEEVSFCGHAAVGACSFLANKKSIISHEKNLRSYPMLSSVATVPFLSAADGMRYDAKVTGNEVELKMDIRHEETECACSLEDILSEIGLGRDDIPPKSEKDGLSWPTFMNSSVARPKTLIPVRTIERLHSALPPQNASKFKDMCDSIDSTGVYLYSSFTKSEVESAVASGKNIAFECRQFPRSSGYPEDPATGIAAGALAASLCKRQISFNSDESGCNTYDVFQGTAMGRPSKIRVKIDGYESTEMKPSLKISYTGLVVFDSLSYSDLDKHTIS